MGHGVYTEMSAVKHRFLGDGVLRIRDLMCNWGICAVNGQCHLEICAENEGPRQVQGACADVAFYLRWLPICDSLAIVSHLFVC